VVASAIPSYAISSFLLLDGFCRTLDKAFKNFWWGFPKDKSRNLSLKSWHSLCLPKDQCGLGFRLMKYVNLFLISKLGWNLLTNHNSSWVSLFQRKYIKYGNVLSSPLSSGSWNWNGIKAIVPIIAQGACFSPSKFSSLSIWSSPWIPTLPLFLPTPRLPYLPSSYPLAISDLLLPSSYTWNYTHLSFLFHPSTIVEIMKIAPSLLHDTVLWTPSSSGTFTTKSVHHLITSSTPASSSPLSQSHWKALWKLNLNHRLKLFLWKMVWNIIPTKF
jgi:hypothetical protein